MKEIDYALMTINTVIGIDQMESIIGLIMLSLQVILIFYRLITGVHNKIKNKQVDGLGQDIENAIEDLQDLFKEDDTNG